MSKLSDIDVQTTTILSLKIFLKIEYQYYSDDRTSLSMIIHFTFENIHASPFPLVCSIK